MSVSAATGDPDEKWAVHDGGDDVITATPERLLPSCLPDLAGFGIVAAMRIRRARRGEGTKSLILLLDV